jgi:uncharacterized protein YjbI with pentapeptide repeats
VLAIGGFWFSAQLNQTNLQNGLDQQQATILQTYIDNIQDLLLNHNLLKSKSSDDVAILARARTLTALQGLDLKRKAALLQFLYEDKPIGTVNPETSNRVDNIILLNGADLRGIDLNGTNWTPVGFIGVGYLKLSGINLNQTDLRGANLSYIFLDNTSLAGADLEGANLNNVYLNSSNLFGANLSDANLSGATLSDADLTFADLLGATVTNQQLDHAKSLYGATMPDGSTHP